MSNKVVILTDSTCDLGEELLNKYDIKVIPLHVNFGTETYDDIIQIKPLLKHYNQEMNNE